MIRLFLIRHGETVSNNKRLIQGRGDPPLSEAGKRQAGMTAERFRSLSVDALYTSDLKRALETAETIAAVKKLSPDPREDLQELCFGEWEGRSFDGVFNGYGSFFEFWVKKKCDSSVKGAEPVASGHKRSVAVLEEILKKYQGGNVLLVTHGGILGLILCHILGLDVSDLWRFKFSNASVSEVLLANGSSRVTLLNDISHLKKGAN